MNKGAKEAKYDYVNNCEHTKSERGKRLLPSLVVIYTQIKKQLIQKVKET